jgi:HK97 family phage major capsid protein
MDISELKALETSLKAGFATMGENIKKTQDTVEQAREEVRIHGTLHAKTADELKKLGEKGATVDAELKKLADQWGEAKDRLQKIEQDGAHKPGGGQAPKSAGEIVTASEQFKAIIGKAGATKMDEVNVGSFFKTAILTADQQGTGTVNTLVQSERVGMIMPAQRRLTIRDLLPNGRTASNLIEFATENVFTNNAQIQGVNSSPTQSDGQIKGESAITFTLNQIGVKTIAHWIPVSRQVLGDAGMLESYINQRLTYGLKLEEEDEVMNGDGTGGKINGLSNQAADYNGGVTNNTVLDTLLKSMNQVSLADYEATGVILHPTDWTNLCLLKDSQGRYLFSDPQSMVTPRIWGKPVVATQSQTQGRFLTGAFSMGAALWDREDATVRISESHSDFFVRNLLVLLAEERVALTVYRPTAFVEGAISHAG